MGKFISITALIILYHTIAIAQMPPASFSENVKKADSFLTVKQYKNAAEFYNKAYRNKEGILLIITAYLVPFAGIRPVILIRL